MASRLRAFGSEQARSRLIKHSCSALDAELWPHSPMAFCLAGLRIKCGAQGSSTSSGRTVGGGALFFFCSPAKGAGDESFPKACSSRAVHLCWGGLGAGQGWGLHASLRTNLPSSGWRVLEMGPCLRRAQISRSNTLSYRSVLLIWIRYG